MAHGTVWSGLASLSLSLACATKTVPEPEVPRPAPSAKPERQRDEPSPTPKRVEPTAAEATTPEGGDRSRLRGWREGPNLAILLTLDEKSAELEQGKSFELWSGLGDEILKASMCARVEIFAVDQGAAARALRQRRAAAAERVLLRKGLPKDRIVVDADTDPSELMARGLDAEALRNGVLLTPLDECPR